MYMQAGWFLRKRITYLIHWFSEIKKNHKSRGISLRYITIRKILNTLLNFGCSGKLQYAN